MVATVIPATRAQPFVKNGCPSQCGNVTIPYPFGTKEVAVLTTVARDCYRPPRLPFLTPETTIPLSSLSIYNISSTRNKLTAIGCNTYGYLKGYIGNKSYSSGCMSLCDQLDELIIGSCWSIMLLELVLTISRIYRGLWPKELIKQREKFFLQNGGVILQQQLSKFNEAVSVKIHTSEELNKATNNFNESNTVGRGGHGTVYKGLLCDNRVVAIKKLMIADHSQVEQFTNEVIVLSQVNHRNVVKLFRCLETEVPLLVYKFIANGTLYEHLQSSGLVRECRLRITAETARALSYSNSAAYPPIIHRDVKSSNILLDEHYTAKTCFQSSQLTEKSDVYSFRVVLAELLTGRKALCFQVPEEERNLAMHYVFTLKKDQLFRIIDHHVLVEGNTTQIQVAMLANRCLRVKGKERPSMKEVATVLEGLRAMLSIRPVSPQESTEGSSSDYGSC
ncbi:hypothetical protein E1A91_D03G010400v1 [Gossypium mustelinum]|uniref:Protein kinase domain-containing protein n=1 Tax=Gossypium mustelinum TaxID=34275 RepID=A0A5D2VIK4_GOSMU|nr:hypothetical protein E1A91_D03G010400v1 [Gossypium mustelinum]